MAYMNKVERSLLIDDYDTLLQEITEERDADAYYVNFMFNALPGKEKSPHVPAIFSMAGLFFFAVGVFGNSTRRRSPLPRDE